MLEDGVWRTISGRRVFIKTGQSLTDAFRETKKFKKRKETLKVFKETYDRYNYEKALEEYEKKEKEVEKLFKDEKDYMNFVEFYNFVESKEIPEAVKNDVLNFKKINRSPYSNSFYDTDNITWDYKPEGSIRISDHWNFQSSIGNKVHCKLKGVDKYTEGWKMARYENGEYIVIKEYKDENS